MRKHFGQLSQLFIDDLEGVDLGNVELKSCGNTEEKFKLTKKDRKAEFFIFFSNIQWEYNFVNIKDMPIFGDTTICVNTVRKLAYLTTDDEGIVMKEAENIIKEPEKYCRWLMSGELNE